MRKIKDTLYIVLDKNGNHSNTCYGIVELSKFLNRTPENTKQLIYRLKNKKDKKIKALGTTLYVFTEQEFFDKEGVK